MLDSATLLWHMEGTLKNCAMGDAAIIGSWDLRKALVVRGKARAPQARRERNGSWTAARRAAFLRHLAATCNVRASARAVKMDESGAYYLRQRSPEFREAWAGALHEGYARLEAELLDRATNGVRETVPQPGGGDRETVKYSDQMALALLRMHRQSVAEHAQKQSGRSAEELVQLIRERLDEIEREANGA